MSEAAAFDALAAEFYQVWFRYHPEQARLGGVRGYEALLPAQDDDDMGVLASWLENLIVALAGLDFNALDRDRRLDLRLLFDEAQTEYEALLEHDWRHRDPLRFLPSAGILHLACPPGDPDRTGLTSLVRAVPEYLRHATGQLLPLAELLAPTLAEATVAAAEEGAAYLRELSASDASQAAGVTPEMEALCSQAAAALGGFAKQLRRDVAPRARGPLGCGPRQWHFRLRKRHGLCLDEEALRRFLGREAARAQAALGSAGEGLGLEGTAEGVSRLLGREPALSGESRRQAYRAACAGIGQKLGSLGLEPPLAAPLEVRDLPQCPRPPGSGGGYHADYERSRGVLYLDPAPQGEAPSLIAHRCLLLGGAGAHLMAFAGGAVGRRLPRRLSASDSLARGWSLYLGERLESDAGVSVTERFLMRWQRWQWLRLAELDLQLHLDGLAPVTLEAELAALEPDTRRRGGLLVGLARHPSDWVAGAAGWRILERTRALRCDQGGESPSEFHHRLFSVGAIPLALLIEELFGAPFWAQVVEGLLD